jgi:hypothetical protein
MAPGETGARFVESAMELERWRRSAVCVMALGETGARFVKSATELEKCNFPNPLPA